ncbi:Flagellar protein fliS [Leclercia adecarboxylata]|uniref:Flagellar protein fliS n=1 Tax=Leclercia adecarboxylata TaxID=83655 RepID=A0A4U9I4P0_9ENTR|nr:Flagellar protein fliS [Leclercia adecarboxylata]
MVLSARWSGARLFLQDGNIPAKGQALSKAINIIENGLKLGLDEEEWR